MASLPPDHVYQGFWVDHTRGRILGSTITIKSNIANIIVALTSIVITFAGAHLWDLVAFGYFLCAARNPLRDGLYHQRQTILRNVTSPGAAALDLLKVCWYWGRIARRPITRTLPVVLLACACSLGFLAAGILSSSIVSIESLDVLVSSAACGFQLVTTVPDNATTMQTLSSDLYGTTVETAHQSGQYARTCYNSSGLNPACQIYRLSHIPFQTSYDKSPFQQASVSTSQSAITMDTGHLDSALVFGINAPPDERITFRRKTTCIPLNMSDYLVVIDVDEEWADYLRGGGLPYPGEKLYRWYAGWDVYGEPISLMSVLNSISNMSGVHKIQPMTSLFTDTQRFELSQYGWIPTWFPVNALYVDQADTAIIGISTGKAHLYTDPVDDPVFSAHVESVANVDITLDALQVYGPDEIASFIGCTEQTQFCTAQNRCTTLTSAMNAFNEAGYLPLNPIENATLYRFAHAVLFGHASIDAAVIFQPLLASEYQINAGLPANQWELEIQSAQATVLVQIQRYIADIATGLGISNSSLDNSPKLPLTAEDHVLCHSQIMKAPAGFSNVGVFGLGLIIGICGVIIVLNITLTNVLKYMTRQNKIKSETLVKWDHDALLQVQRAAFEGYGILGWSRHYHGVPVQAPAAIFDGLSELSIKQTMPLTPLPAATSTNANGTTRQVPQSASVNTAPVSRHTTGASPGSNGTGQGRQTSTSSGITYAPAPLTVDLANSTPSSPVSTAGNVSSEHSAQGIAPIPPVGRAMNGAMP